jgi:hypothetical protein
MSTHALEKSYDPRKYDYGCYDQYFCLKPPLLLILAIVFLCRGFLMPFIVLLTSVKRAAGDTAALVSGSEHAVSMLAAVPAVLVLYAMIRRVPEANRFARWAWKHARFLLTLSILFDVSLGIVTLHLHEQALTAVRLALDLYILIYIHSAKRVKDTLSDFPASLSN